MAATYKLATIIKNPTNEAEFLLLKQTPPPSFGNEEYDSYIDTDLWDLPSAKLSLRHQKQIPQTGRIEISGSERFSDEIDLSEFDVDSALKEVLEKVGYGEGETLDWGFCKYVEEASFGPGPPVNTVYMVAKMAVEDQNLPDDGCMWMSLESCENWLLDVKPGGCRIGPFAVVGYINDLKKTSNWKMPSTIKYQEYPPGIVVAPMGSRTLQPFTTTNLVVFAPESVPGDSECLDCIASGDAMIVDPGCSSKYYEELKEVMYTLPKKLIVFVTHHHRDHVDGLSVVQKCNPDAILLAHENTMRRIKKGDWSLGYTSISGGEVICIGGQRLNVISAPGHTDGHMALHHVKTQSLIVGDHCVGQGSAALDSRSGGNMGDYFNTTYKFLEIAPNALIPMHGRLNLWPKNMLCGYLKNRRQRESSILKAIEGGAQTLFDITSKAYADVDVKLWLPASSNVKLSVDHLAQQNKLPKDFSMRKYQRSCGAWFYLRWLWEYLRHKKSVGITVAGMAASYLIYQAIVSSKQLGT